MTQKARNAAMSLQDEDGRKYLTADENVGFCRAARLCDLETALFALTLYHTGCRISEALVIKRSQLDLLKCRIRIKTLKQHGKVRHRWVPVQQSFIHELAQITKSGRLWKFSRSSGYRRIKRIMKHAGIPDGPHACPKGLRHGFGIACIEYGVPLPTIQSWMGHTDINTTYIYLKAVGKEERTYAERLWLRDVPFQYRPIFDEIMTNMKSMNSPDSDNYKVDQIIVNLQEAKDEKDLQDIYQTYGLNQQTEDDALAEESFIHARNEPWFKKLKDENIMLKQILAEQQLKIHVLEEKS